MQGSSVSCYELYIRECKDKIRKGKVVYVYYNYQLEELKKEFGDKLVVNYDSKYDWWLCMGNKKKGNNSKYIPVSKEKDGRGRRKYEMSRNDVDIEGVRKMRDSGYSLREIANKYKCSITTIYRRLN